MQETQSLLVLQEDFTSLSRDLFHVICPFVSNKDLYSLIRTGREVSNISRRYLRPTQDNLLETIRKEDAVVVASQNGYMEVVGVLLQDDKVYPSANWMASLFNWQVSINIRMFLSLHFKIQHYLQHTDINLDSLNISRLLSLEIIYYR